MTGVKSYVLRYWEDELDLHIGRNELGHRYYTEEDVKRFQEIRELKERGLQLKAIRLILKNGKLDRLADGENTQAEKAVSAAKTAEKMPADAQHGQKTVEVLKAAEKVTGEVEPIKTTSVVGEESGEEKAARLQWLLKQLFREVLQENNEAMCREVRESILKEMDELLRKKRGLLWNKDDRKTERKKAEQDKTKSMEEQKKAAVKESTKEKPKPLQL